MGRLEVLDLRTAAFCGGIKGMAGSVRALAVHPTRAGLASAGLDRFLRVHDTRSRAGLAKEYLKTQLTGGSRAWLLEGLITEGWRVQGWKGPGGSTGVAEGVVHSQGVSSLSSCVVFSGRARERETRGWGVDGGAHFAAPRWPAAGVAFCPTDASMAPQAQPAEAAREGEEGSGDEEEQGRRSSKGGKSRRSKVGGSSSGRHRGRGGDGAGEKKSKRRKE